MRDCSITNALDVIGERWTLVALREIMLGNRRFDEIVRNTGASRDILATRLRKLVDAGVLEKLQYEEHPPRYEYLLTESGLALRPVLFELMVWGDKYVTTGPPPSVWEHDCGSTLRAHPVCETCGEVITFDDVTPRRLGRVR